MRISLILWCYGLLMVSLPAQSETLKVASIDWCPQLCEGSDKPGYINDIVTAIFSSSPYSLQTRVYPWSRAIKYVSRGSNQALLSPAKAEAPDLLYPKHEVGIQRMCFFTSKSSQWRYTDAESLKGMKIGIANDTSIEELNEFIGKNKKQFQYLPYNDSYLATSFRKLDAKRIDSFLFTFNSTVYYLNNHNLDYKYRSAGCVSLAKVYMAFTPVSAQREKVQLMMNFFDDGMARLKSNGQLQIIMDKYGLEDWQKYLK